MSMLLQIVGVAEFISEAKIVLTTKIRFHMREQEPVIYNM